uniref:BHLH domain-containing protein n=1 Tax=Magallana gigas TaxID=29159 RepID=A0A8W8NHB4_MAGGI
MIFLIMTYRILEHLEYQYQYFIMVQYVKRQTSAQMVAKQHLKLHLRRIRNREYSRLRDMVPSIAKKDKISKVTVIEEAVKYIDELHRALFERLQSKAAAAADSKLVSDEHVKDFIHTLIPVDLFSKTNSANLTFEKSQRHPSYIMPKKQKVLPFRINRRQFYPHKMWMKQTTNLTTRLVQC